MAVSPRLIAERRLVRRLRSAGATSSNAAHELQDLRWMDERRLHGLQRAGAIHEAAPHRYYLDEPAYLAMRWKRRRRILAIVGIVLTAYALFWFSGISG